MRNHRKTYSLSAKSFAEKCGIGISRYRRIEGDGESTNPLITNLEELSKIASQFDMEPHELVYYILNEGAPVPEDSSFAWQGGMFAALKRVNQKLLSEFTGVISRSKKDRIEVILDIATRCFELNPRSLLKLQEFIKDNNIDQ